MSHKSARRNKSGKNEKKRRRRRRLLCETATGESNTKEEITDNADNSANNGGCVIKIFGTVSNVMIDYTTLPECGRQNNNKQ